MQQHPEGHKKTIRSRLLTGIAWATVGKAASGLVGLSITASLTRVLSMDDMGTYFLAISILGVFALLGQLGIPRTIVRFIGEALGQGDWAKVRRAAKLALYFGVFGSVFSSLIFILFGNEILLGGLKSTSLLRLKWLIAIWILVIVMNSIIAESFRGLHDIKLATLFGGLLSALIFLMTLVLSMTFYAYLELSRVIILSIISSGLSMFLSIVLLRFKLKKKQDYQGNKSSLQAREMIRVAWPLWITGCALFFLSQSDIFILGMFRPVSEVAIYGATSKLLALVAMSLMIVNAVIPSTIAELYSQNKISELEKILRTTATIAGIPTILILMIFVLLGDSLLAFIYGDIYRGGGLILGILSVGQMANVFTGSCGMTLMMTGHQATMMVITLVCGSITIVLALLLAGSHGAIGVAIAAATGMVLQNLGMLVGVKLNTGMWTHFKVIRISQLRKLAGKVR